MMPEQWKSFPGLDMYKVSDLGNVWSCKSNRLLRPWLRSGYPQVSLRADGKDMFRFVHDLVLTTFVGPRPAGLQCCHGNGDQQVRTWRSAA
jgi:hypothetical protein